MLSDSRVHRPWGGALLRRRINETIGRRPQLCDSLDVRRQLSSCSCIWIRYPQDLERRGIVRARTVARPATDQAHDGGAEVGRSG